MISEALSAISCLPAIRYYEQFGNKFDDHFAGTGKMIEQANISD